MSFTSGGALKSEALTVARLFWELRDWKAVQEAVFRDNLLQLNTISSQQRLFSEVRGRLQALSEHELNLYINSSLQQQGYYIWLMLCRRYPFIGEFALSVIIPHFRSLEKLITPSDYLRFWESKLKERPELEKITPTTQKKLRSGLFLFMRETGIVNKNMEICPIFISSELYKHLKTNSPDELLFFPIAGTSGE